MNKFKQLFTNLTQPHLYFLSLVFLFHFGDTVPDPVIQISKEISGTCDTLTGDRVKVEIINLDPSGEVGGIIERFEAECAEKVDGFYHLYNASMALSKATTGEYIYAKAWEPFTYDHLMFPVIQTRIAK